MGPLIIAIFLGLASKSFQKSIKYDDLSQESLDLETLLQNLITKDVNLKINLNKKKTQGKDKVQYLGELSYEKETGFNNLNKKLAKLLDGLQQRVLNEDTRDPTCSCDDASKLWAGAIKCQCGSSVPEDDDADGEEESREAERQDLDDRNDDYMRGEESRQNKKRDRREDRFDDGEQDYRQLARVSKSDNREDGYWSDDNSCYCESLRSTGDKNGQKYLRCRCVEPGRQGDNRDDRADGYWTDDTSCGCKLLRSVDDDNYITQYLKCGCNSPARVGDAKEDGSTIHYWYDTRCGCKTLRNMEDEDDKDVHYLRCRCNSPMRVGGKTDHMYDRDSGYWTDDTSCGCNLLRNTDDKSDITHYLNCGCNSPISRLGDEKDWAGNNRCGCKTLRNIEDDEDVHYLRCRCNSPERVGGEADIKEDRDEGYWTDDTSCGCNLLRNTDRNSDITHYLKCGCNSPARVGDKDEGYWTDDTSCGCTLLRNNDDEKDVKNLRCRCNSPLQAGVNSFEGYDNPMESGRFGTVLSDLSDDDYNIYESKNLDRNTKEHKLNTLIDFILNKEHDIDLSELSSMKRKILFKLRDIMPSLRNVDASKLQDKIASIFDENENQLREKNKEKSNMENPLTLNQIQRLLKIIEQQKLTTKDKKQMFRRSMPEDVIGVPFTYQLQGLAQVNA